MNPATTVPSIADVDPDSVVDGDESMSPADRAGEPASGAESGSGSTEAAAPTSLSGAATAGEPPPATGSPAEHLPEEAVPLDYVADYDDDQTSGIDDEVVDQRIPFT